MIVACLQNIYSITYHCLSPWCFICGLYDIICKFLFIDSLSFHIIIDSFPIISNIKKRALKWHYMWYTQRNSQRLENMNLKNYFPFPIIFIVWHRIWHNQRVHLKMHIPTCTSYIRKRFTRVECCFIIVRYRDWTNLCSIRLWLGGR